MQPLTKEEWEKLPYETRLLHTEYIFRALREHLHKGGTFRKLIYGRLSFNHDSYGDLYHGGGLEISNAFFEAREWLADCEAIEQEELL